MKNHNTTEVPKVQITRGKNTGNLQRPDKGKLPGNIPEPKFVADPNHRRKVFTGELLALATAKSSDKCTMTKMDCTRLQKNFGYMARTLKNRAESKFVDAGQAVIEHHFNNHQYCGEWCFRRRQTLQQQLESKRFYRCKTKDAKLYDVLTKKIARFITLDRLKEISHGMDTQVNESFNNTLSWFAPKNKVYCGSSSLSNRLCIAMGVHSIGLVRYFTRLMKAMGIVVTPPVAHFLRVKQDYRARRIAKSKTTAKKKDRVKRKLEALKDDERQAVKERAKRDGTYKKGMNMDEGGTDVYTEEDLQHKPSAKKKSMRNNDVICKHCGLKGHSTTRSKNCLKNQNNNQLQPAAVPSAPAENELLALDAAADVNAMDCMPLLDHGDDGEDADSLFGFYDAREEYSSDAEEDTMSIGII